ncbi:MAG: YdcF family protein, partial [Pseudomonadota bacterium]
MKSLIEALLFPPGVIIIIAVAGLLLTRRAPRASLLILTGALVLLWLLSLPVIATLLMNSLQTYPALT